MSSPDKSEFKTVHLWQALIPVVALIGLIAINLLKFEGEAHIPLILASGVAALVGLSLGHSWKSIEKGILEGILIGMKAILILCVIGVMIGTWIAAGVVPFMIYYGLQILSPGIFLVAACLICAVVSLATGSSWTTASTVGIALMGVATGLNIPAPMAAGAVISGAYFGDKMSPLSDSTNLAPAVAGSELFEHIRHMLYTTLPALFIALILYGLLGMRGFEGSIQTNQVTEITDALKTQFDLSFLLILPPLFVIGSVFHIAHYGYVSKTGNEAVDALLSHGGLDSMMHTISLVLCALSFGGIMERTGLLKTLAQSILNLARSTGSLVAATVCTCLGMNILAPDQYLSIIVPGRMYRDAYRTRGLHPKNLSRTLEDAGTLSSPLVAWNSCGAFMAGTLAVSPIDYLPYAFLNLFAPAICIFLAYTGWTIVRLPNAKNSNNNH